MDDLERALQILSAAFASQFEQLQAPGGHALNVPRFPNETPERGVQFTSGSRPPSSKQSLRGW